MWQGKVGVDLPLESSGSNSVERRKKEGKRKRKKENREEEEMNEKLHILSRIYRDRTVGFHRSKRQSSSTR